MAIHIQLNIKIAKNMVAIVFRNAKHYFSYIKIFENNLVVKANCDILFMANAMSRDAKKRRNLGANVLNFQRFLIVER